MRKNRSYAIPTDNVEITGAAKVNLRSEPRPGAPVLEVLDKGTVLKTDNTFHNDSFVKVITRRGRLGYVAKDFVTYV